MECIPELTTDNSVCVPGSNWYAGATFDWGACVAYLLIVRVALVWQVAHLDLKTDNVML